MIIGSIRVINEEQSRSHHVTLLH